jgi:hypothetical protein
LAQRAAESRLRAVLEACHPAPLHLFSSLDRDITLDFITDYPTLQQAARVGPARMEAFCRRHGYPRRTSPDALGARLRPYLLAASPGTTAGKADAAVLSELLDAAGQQQIPDNETLIRFPKRLMHMFPELSGGR